MSSRTPEQPSIEQTLGTLHTHFKAGDQLDTPSFLRTVYQVRELGYEKDPKVDHLLKLLGKARRDIVGGAVLGVLEEGHRTSDIHAILRNIGALEMLGLNTLPGVNNLIGVLTKAHNLDQEEGEGDQLESWRTRNDQATKNRKPIYSSGAGSTYTEGRIYIQTSEVAERDGRQILGFQEAMFPNASGSGGSGGCESYSDKQAIFTSGEDHIAVYTTGASGNEDSASGYRLAHRLMSNLKGLDDVIINKEQLTGISGRIFNELDKALGFKLTKDLTAGEKALSVIKFCYLNDKTFAVVGYTLGCSIYVLSDNRLVSLVPRSGLGVYGGVSVAEIKPGSRILMTQGGEVTKGVSESDIENTLRKVPGAEVELVEATRRRLSMAGINDANLSALVIDVQRKPRS